MSDKSHGPLEQGLLYHEKCEGCVPTRPPLKMSLDEDDLLIAIDRHTRCEGFVWDFSVGLMADHKVTRMMEHVVRACSAHANYHLHKGNYLRPKKLKVSKTFGTLDNEQEADDAYNQSAMTIIGDAIEWRDRWRQGKT
ncbi:hypothetical protein [Arthrobacter sp. ZGTC412]|uniref:hypothetical protein n=1 Tax=Arthrobacter sp. ZGTC412 TaxID=2058900 RepID=UPI000CE4BD5A|nr:hypothetical protein [Arthrobacter sp. ZGTC412]